MIGFNNYKYFSWNLLVITSNIGCYGQAINLGLPLDYYFEFQKLQLFQIDRNNPGQYHNNSQEYQLNKQEFKVVGSKSQTTAIQQFLESNTNPYKSLLLLQKNALLMLRKRLLVISEFISTTNDLEIMEKVQNIMARMELIPTFHGNDLINLIGITSRVNKACQLLAEIESKTRVLQNY